MTLRIFLLLIVLPLGILPSAVHAGWNNDKEWAVRKKVTLTPLSAQTADVPVLIRLHTGNFDFLAANDNGSDLRVVAADDTTELKFHIEKWDSLNQLALVWVKLPVLAAKTEIFLYFGNPAAQSVADVKGTYANNIAVFHFAEQSGNPLDSGPLGLHAAQSSAQHVAASFANGGIGFDGTQSVSLPGMNGAAEYTFTVWAKPLSLDGNLLQWGGNNLGVMFEGGKVRIHAGTASTLSSEALSVGKWHHVGLTLTDTTIRLYMDGKSVAEVAAGAPPVGGGVTLGGPAASGPGFKGELDEVQISAVARDPAWIAVQAAQGPDGKLVTLGGDEMLQGDAGTASYFGIILQSVTLDGWVVIGVLALMFLIALWVMFDRAVYVTRTESSNSRFMEKFRELSTDLAMIDKAQGRDELEFSSLYRIYHIGATELAHRFKDTDSAHTDKILSPQSLDSIRASLDAGLVKETHRLNKLMVLLTIAISGGPFLGLLGTVLGVMITFAAIAASGDVNVNAIAPGIAAALVATVAGLGVAIPALFGYNYLSSRIKTISSDMSVFIDEFITKLAENYCR